jgi:hypothetical protein
VAATWFVDLENGNDANTGTSFAQRLKTINQTITKGAAASDTVRVMASKDATSVGNATWTDNSSTVTLAAAVTKNIDLCATAFTASANVTCTTDGSNRKQGAQSSKNTVAAAFTTGLIAYDALGSAQDFSAYKQVSFWIRASVAIAASTLTLTLCSDAAGATPVNTIAIPAIPQANRWQAVTVDTGGALGASIQSVALNALLDPGTVDIWLDNILACKDSTLADSLTLTSVISKNISGEPWFALQSINDATLILDGQTETPPGNEPKYYSATTPDTTTTYKRDCIQIPALTSAGTNTTWTVIGAPGTRILISGGWNRTDMSTQTGFTFIDGQNGQGTFFSPSNARNCIDVERFGTFRFATCYSIAGGLDRYTDIYTGASTTLGIDIPFTGGNGFTFTRLLGSGQNAHMRCRASNAQFVDCVFMGSGGGDIFQAAGVDLTFTRCTFVRAAQQGIALYDTASGGREADRCLFLNCYFKNALDVRVYAGTHNMVNCKLDGTTEFDTSQSSTIGENPTIFSHNHDRTTDNHQIRGEGWAGMSETGVDRRTASGIAWKISPTSVNRDVFYPIRFPLAKVLCTSGVATTVSAWMKRDNVGLTGSLVCKGEQISGVPNDVVSSMVGAAGTYEKVSITFTPTATGVVEIEAQVYGGTSFNFWVDDMDFT